MHSRYLDSFADHCLVRDGSHFEGMRLTVSRLYVYLVPGAQDIAGSDLLLQLFRRHLDRLNRAASARQEDGENGQKQASVHRNPLFVVRVGGRLNPASSEYAWRPQSQPWMA